MFTFLSEIGLSKGKETHEKPLDISKRERRERWERPLIMTKQM